MTQKPKIVSESTQVLIAKAALVRLRGLGSGASECRTAIRTTLEHDFRALQIAGVTIMGRDRFEVVVAYPDGPRFVITEAMVR